MADELQPNVVDVPLTVMDQTPPAHAGPVGRVQSLKDAEVVHYLPPQPGGVGGGASPQLVSVQQREAFTALANTMHDVTGGNSPSNVFPPGELLDTLGDQLVSVARSVPKVWNGSDWSEYGTTRVLAGKLSQDVLHTSNRTIQASDSATIGGVTCFVWTETASASGLSTSFVGFRASDGAWIVQPQVLYAMSITSDTALAKVVSDGTRFWVVFNKANSISPNIGVQAFDTHGALLATAGKTRNWLTSPGFWDIVAQPDGAAVILAQPASYSPGTNVHVEFTRFTISGAVISQSSHTDTSINCNGPVAWLTNDGVISSSFSYLATLGLFEGAAFVLAWEVNTTSMTQVHEYDVAILGPASFVDSFTGYLISSSGIGVVVAVSLLSEYSPASGPPNDPALRNVQVYFCTRGGSAGLIKRAQGVCLQSRAFSIPTSPAASPDYYAVTYYQSGGGVLPSQRVITLAHNVADNMIGDAVQPLNVSVGDELTGAPSPVGVAGGRLIPTQAIGSITHNAGDGVVAATRRWTFLNASFQGSSTGGPILTCQYGLLVVTGSAIPNNNQSYRITRVISATVVETEGVGSAGHAITDDTLAGVSASVTSQFVFQSPRSLNGDVIPPPLMSQFAPGGHLTIAGSSWPANNNTFTIQRIFLSAPQLDVLGGPGAPDVFNYVVVTPIGTLIEDEGTAWTITIAPVFGETWIFANDTFDATAVGNNLVVSGAAHGANNGTFAINANLSNALQTSAATSLLPEVFAAPLPSMSINLIAPDTALTFTFNAVTFDDSYLGGQLIISGAAHAVNNDTYTILRRTGAHTIQCTPTLGTTGHRSETFGGGVTAKVVLLADSSPAFQPCWFLTPLSVAQQIAGRFEYGVAFADWRFDGATLSDPNIGADFSRNRYPFALTSVPAIGGSRSVVLPYRAQSFTAGQVVRVDPNGIGIVSVSESTVGLKRFSLPAGAFGQSAINSGEMFLPGPMAGSFTASGFHEDGVALAFEAPFYISQETDGTVIGMTRLGTYQVTVVAEVMDENGDRTFTIPSPPLTFTLTGTNNVATYSGRLIGPTNRTLVSIAIYRTAMQGGTPTVIHYKVTNDLDVNGAGFTFSAASGGPNDTWTFRDTITDVAILSQEELYTDKGFTPRFPAPAFSQGVGSWCNRTWLIGYDGAIWMSGEKTEGDAVWFTPAFRFVLPTDDKPVALAPLDEYLLVFCARSIWYIPKTDFPAANLQSGALPTPVQLPFTNGCTGQALTIRGGVAYASTAGGVWLITRQLTNVWLSQPVQDDMDGALVTALRVDGKQRMFVLTGGSSMLMFDQVSGAWSIWRTPNTSVLGAVLGGLLTYQDGGNGGGVSSIAQHSPGVYIDTIPTAAGGPTFPIAPDVQLAGISLAGVRSYKRTWSIQIVGLYKGPHNLNVVVTYPDDDMAPTAYPPFTPDPTLAYVYEVNPNPEEATTFSVRIFADFAGVGSPGNSFVLELLSFEVGVEQGIGRMPSTKRISSG